MSMPQPRSAAIVLGSLSICTASFTASAGAVLVGVGRPASWRHLPMARSWAAPTLGVLVGEAADVVGAALDEDDDDEPDGELLPQPARAAAASAAGTANLRTGRRLTVASPLAAWLVPCVVVRLAMLMALLPVVGPFLPT
jgi:hypothetical protein